MKRFLSQPLKQMRVLTYLVIALLLAALGYQAYRYGYYNALILPALLTPLFLVLAWLCWLVEPKRGNNPIAMIAVTALTILVVFQPTTAAGFNYWLWLGLALPLLVFLLLPTRFGVALLLAALPLLLLLRGQALTPLQQWLYLNHYLLILVVSWLFQREYLRREQNLEAEAGRDWATGLPNWHGLQLKLKTEVSRAHFTRKPLACLVIRLPQAELLTQVMGKDKGEDFITHAYQTALNNGRTGDEVYLVDHQTLVMLLPNTSANGALVAKERLHLALVENLFCELAPLEVHLKSLALGVEENAQTFEQRLLDAQRTPSPALAD